MDKNENNVKSYQYAGDRTGQLWGQYRIVSSVAQGRFSNCYLAAPVQHPSRQLVIEILPLTLTPADASLFLQSAQRLTQLVHPHILRVFDPGVEHFVPFIVMDYISHVPLRQLYRPGTGLSLENLLPYLRQIASALQYAHDKGCLHKNLSPDTALLGWNSSVLLSDFSISALEQNELYRSYQRAKTSIDPLSYCAPEQIQGQPQKASDQYALAAMIYEWLAGTPLFVGSSNEIARQQIHTTPPDLRQKMPMISPAVAEVVATALTKDPQRRFANPGALVNALEQAYALQQPALNHPASPTPHNLRTSIPTPPETPEPLLDSPRPSPVIAMASIASAPPKIPATLPDMSRHSSPPIKKRQKMTNRRAFLVSAASAAVLGGVGSWLVWQKLHPALAADTLPTLTTTTTTHSTGAGGSSQPVLDYTAHTARVNSVAWSPDGQHIASASDDKLVLICDRAGKTLLTYSGHSDHVNAVAWSPDGKHIASASSDQSVQVWDAHSGSRVYTYTGHAAAVNCVDWSSDSRMLVSGSDDTTVHAWFATRGDVFLFYRGHTNAVLSVAWSPNIQMIASGSWDNTMQVCSTIMNDAFAVGDQVFSYAAHTAEVYAVAWSPDGTRIASAGGDNVLQVCSGTDGSSVKYPPRKHAMPVHSVSWSPDGRTLATGCNDATVQTWNARIGEHINTFTTHKDAVLSVAWSPDSKFISSASVDKTVQLYQL